MRPPVCDICDADVDPAGGLVRFQPDDASREWHRRSQEEGFVGHPPDTGWFCADHVEAAREAALTHTYSSGVQYVASLARWVDVRTLDVGDPDGLSAPAAVPARSVEGLSRVRFDLRRETAPVLGGAPTTRSSTGWRLDDVHDRSISHVSVGPYDEFDRIEYRRVDDVLVAGLVEWRLVRGGELLALVRVEPADGQAAPGAVFDRARVWVGDEQARPWTDAAVRMLTSQPPDLLDPAPDLVGVDPGAGRLAASDGFLMQWVEWDLDGVDVLVFEAALLDALGDLLAAAGLYGPPELTATTSRAWEPMDGSQPPNCPFTDTTVHEGGQVRVRREMVHWSDDDVHSAGVTLTVRDHHSVSAFGDNGAGRRLWSVRLYRPTTGDAVRTVDELVARVRSVS